jgi:nucleotide-binding universal stress UspA family protein
VSLAQANYGLSERRARKLLGVVRTSYRYEPVPDRNGELRLDLLRLARQKPRFGWPPLLRASKPCEINHGATCAPTHQVLNFGASLSCMRLYPEEEVGAMQNPVTDRWFHPAVILAATNLNDMDRLMPLALKQATNSGARLVLLHVLSTGTIMPPLESVGLTIASEMNEATAVLKPWSEEAQHQGCSCETVIREGDIAQQISAAVREFKADLLVIGVPSRTKLGELLFGSVAEEVLRSVNLPVMTVGPEAHPLAAGDRKPVVVHATSLRGEASRPSAALACQMAASQGAKLLLLHVLPPIENAKMMQKGLSMGPEAEVLYELRSLATEVGADCGIEVEPQVLHGSPSIEILAKASEFNASLIVLGAHRAAFEELARKRIVYDVWAHASCPVLTLRQPAENPAEQSKEKIAFHQ